MHGRGLRHGDAGRPDVPECGETRLNVAEVEGHFGQIVVTNDDDAEICVDAPDISIIKTAGDAADDTVLHIATSAGQTTIDVVYHYHVCNESDVALTDVVVTDDNGTPGDTSDDIIVDVGDLDVDECVDVDSGTVTLDVPDVPACGETRLNVAEVEGHFGQVVVTDEDDAEICLDVEPTPTPTRPNRREPTPTKTITPTSTPTLVVTVFPATQVPPATSTPVGVIVTCRTRAPGAAAVAALA